METPLSPSPFTAFWTPKVSPRLHYYKRGLYMARIHGRCNSDTCQVARQVDISRRSSEMALVSLAATTRDVANPMAMVREVIQSAVPPTASAQFRSSIQDFVDMLNSHTIEFCAQLTGGDIDRSDIEQWCSTHEPKVMVHHIPFIEAALGFTLPRRNKMPPSAQLVLRESDKENSSCLSAMTVRRNGMSRRRRTDDPTPDATPPVEVTSC